MSSDTSTKRSVVFCRSDIWLAAIATIKGTNRVLSSFEVINFRALRCLRIGHLGRVNLIVGRNGVGKTTLLEALRFYASADPWTLRQCLMDHDEWGIATVAGEPQLGFRALFHQGGAEGQELELGPAGEDTTRLHVRLVDVERVEESDGTYHYERMAERAKGASEGEVFKGILVRQSDREAMIMPSVRPGPKPSNRYIGPAFIPAGGVGTSDLCLWWESIALTKSEKRAIDVVRILLPIVGAATIQGPLARTFMVALEGQDNPVPLTSLGGGFVRCFQYAVATEYAFHLARFAQTSFSGLAEPKSALGTAQILLIDEFENGIHHSLHSRLWEAVFDLARRHDLQVFATTHSSDCLKGFADAQATSKENDGLVIRLENVEGEDQTGAVIIDREGLPIIVRDSIEVR